MTEHQTPAAGPRGLQLPGTPQRKRTESNTEKANPIPTPVNEKSVEYLDKQPTQTYEPDKNKIEEKQKSAKEKEH